jgi:hypothetical protein
MTSMTDQEWLESVEKSLEDPPHVSPVKDWYYTWKGPFVLIVGHILMAGALYVFFTFHRI